MRKVPGAVINLSRLAVAALVLIAIPSPASAAWPTSGRLITAAPQGQMHPAIATDGSNGAIITWQDLRSPRVNIFAHHVLASGELDALWPFDGRALLSDSLAMVGAAGGQTSPRIVSDGAGGAIVAWLDLRSGVTETDIFAQHVLTSGTVDGAWPANGTPLVAIEGQQNTHAMVSDGAGGAFVTWQDTRPGASVADIYAQHVLASGVADSRWPVNGLLICGAPGLQEFPAMVEDGSGGAIISWDDGRSSTTGFDIYAQHVSSAGVADPLWPANGRAVCAASGDQGHPTISSDLSHGAIVVWTDSRIVGTAHIFAQHVLGSGAVDPVWPVDGRAVSAAGMLETRPLVVSDSSGGAILTWQAFTVQLGMFAQHVTSTGIVDAAWPAGGRALSNSDRQQTHADIAADGAGGAIIVWEENSDILAQHVLASGALDPAYPAAGRTVCDLPSGQGSEALVATGGAPSEGGSGAIVTWSDGRNGVDLDIFALQVLNAGTLDAPPVTSAEIFFARPSPNPAHESITLRYSLPQSASVRLFIFDITGRRVRELVTQAESAGEHAVLWDMRDGGGQTLGVGMYFARLESGHAVLIRRIAALR